MERFLDKISKNTDLLLRGGLYAPTINHFFNRRFISGKRVSLLSLCEFSYFTLMLSSKYMHRLPPKLSLSCLNILYPAKRNWLFDKELLILVSDTKNLSNTLQMQGFSKSNLFLREFIFRGPTMTFFGRFLQFWFKLLRVVFTEKESFNSSMSVVASVWWG